MAASAGSLQLERDPTFAAVRRLQRAETGAQTRERPVEARIREWQSTAGNAAVARMLQREAAPDGAQAGGSGGGTATAPTETHSTLQYGARGDEVRDLQQRLNDEKAARVPLVIDGIFGRKTQAAVRKYQESHPPLSIDGDAGPETWTALDKAATGGQAVPESSTGTEAESDTETESGTETEKADPYETGKAHYAAKRYGQAYDEFTKAWEARQDLAFLWNRAQALMYLGGRREEAIALFEQLASEVTGDAQIQAQKKIAELRGPGKSGDGATDKAAVRGLNAKGSRHFGTGEYAKAYDEFTKAYEVTGDPHMLWNRAESLNLLGGRRMEAIALFEQFAIANVPEDKKVAARREIVDLRGPVAGADEAENKSVAAALVAKGRAQYGAGRYAQAYDEFSKAYEVKHEPAYLFNRAQAMRLIGGRRSEAISLYEQFLAGNIAEDDKKAARVFLAELKGAEKKPDDPAPPAR